MGKALNWLAEIVILGLGMTTIIILTATLAKSYMPAVPVIHILEPGDSLPKFDGELSRIEIRASPASRGTSYFKYWPKENLTEVRFRAVYEYKYELTTNDILDSNDNPIRLWYGGTHSEDSTQSWFVTEYHPNGVLEFPEPIETPQAGWEEVTPSQWNYYVNNSPREINQEWILNEFEGQGEIHLNWPSFENSLFYRPDKFRERPLIRYTTKDFRIIVSYYPE